MKYALVLTCCLSSLFSTGAVASANFNLKVDANVGRYDKINRSEANHKTSRLIASSNAAIKEFDRTVMAEAKPYQTLVQEAEGLARQLIQQALQDGQVETIVVRIVGDRFGEVAPLLTIRVSRAEWQAQPNIQQWARYGGRSSMQLLGYLEPQAPSEGFGAIAATPEVAPMSDAPDVSPPAAAPAPAVAPAANQRPRAAAAPGRESPIPGEVPEPSDPGYR
jgi:hypothetical protein